uniref:Jacalin-type lectin domain-containing protein n=1 Tax=Ananas comosus var. bracteatus TaxID=296719 RepID=A0A6V7NID1_ANACO|nr:unnamed protein product [Ananas comosus var. bracteatus]
MGILKQGPWGEATGHPFDMGEVKKILGFEVWSSDGYLHGIQFHYLLQDGQKGFTPVYGGKVGGHHKVHMVRYLCSSLFAFARVPDPPQTQGIHCSHGQSLPCICTASHKYNRV